MNEKVFTPEDIAKDLLISVASVRIWLREGKLKGLKAGRQWRIKESDLNEFLRQPSKN